MPELSFAYSWLVSTHTPFGLHMCSTEDCSTRIMVIKMHFKKHVGIAVHIPSSTKQLNTSVHDVLTPNRGGPGMRSLAIE